MADPVEREVKIPHFFAEVEKDSMRVEDWIERVEALRSTHGWTSLQTVGHAITALRGQAILQVKYFKHLNRRVTTDWALLKPQLLKQYGTGIKDTSSVANLHIIQTATETVAGFNTRVISVVNEFLETAHSSLSQFDNVALFADHQEAAEYPTQRAYVGVNDANRNLALGFFRWCTDYNFTRFKDYLGMNVLVNGLRSNLQPYVRQSRPTGWDDALTEAHRAAKIVKGPETKTLGLEQPAKAASINAAYRGRGGRGRGSGSNRGGAASTRGKGGSSQYADRTCYYCNIKGHVQKYCQKRINRNAKGVSAPRSVNEIAEEDLLFQSDEEESQNDDYLAAAINQDNEEEYDEDAYVNSLQINSLHLN